MAKGARRVDDGPSAAFEHGRRSGASSRRGRPKR
jgi:hypothetical protein